MEYNDRRTPTLTPADCQAMKPGDAAYWMGRDDTICVSLKVSGDARPLQVRIAVLRDLGRGPAFWLLRASEPLDAGDAAEQYNAAVVWCHTVSAEGLALVVRWCEWSTSMTSSRSRAAVTCCCCGATIQAGAEVLSDQHQVMHADRRACLRTTAQAPIEHQRAA